MFFFPGFSEDFEEKFGIGKEFIVELVALGSF